jgi:hypothetical protein
MRGTALALSEMRVCKLSKRSHYGGMPANPTPFDHFYTEHFLAEHRHPANVAVHVAGTVLGLLWLPATLLSPLPWLVLLFPAVHALPGLLGHRLFERNAAVGDVRVLRRDFSALWFIAANHRMTWQLLRGRRRP